MPHSCNRLSTCRRPAPAMLLPCGDSTVCLHRTQHFHLENLAFLKAHLPLLWQHYWTLEQERRNRTSFLLCCRFNFIRSQWQCSVLQNCLILTPHCLKPKNLICFCWYFGFFFLIKKNFSKKSSQKTAQVLSGSWKLSSKTDVNFQSIYWTNNTAGKKYFLA